VRPRFSHAIPPPPGSRRCLLHVWPSPDATRSDRSIALIFGNLSVARHIPLYVSLDASRMMRLLGGCYITAAGCPPPHAVNCHPDFFCREFPHLLLLPALGYVIRAIFRPSSARHVPSPQCRQYLILMPNRRPSRAICRQIAHSGDCIISPRTSTAPSPSSSRPSPKYSRAGPSGRTGSTSPECQPTLRKESPPDGLAATSPSSLESSLAQKATQSACSVPSLDRPQSPTRFSLSRPIQ
jgi:hypothetical protein